MTTHRPERVADLLRGLLATLIHDQLRDPRVGFVTVTEVLVSPDLKHARIFVSRLGSGQDRGDAVAALNHAAPFLRRELGRRSHLKYVPTLAFAEDASIEQGFRVERLLDEARRARSEAPGPADDDVDDERG